MIDLNGILNALQTPNASRTAMIGGGAAAAGLATGLLAGKSGRKFIGKAAKYGAVAALGGLAYHAVTRSRTQGPSHPAPPGPAGSPTPAAPEPDYQSAPAGSAYLPAPDDTAALQRRARSLLRAVIAAAKADGTICDTERQRISERLAAASLDAADRAFVEFELVRPLNIDDVVMGVECPEHAAEIYAASLVAIDRNGAIERSYLNLLAARLGLDAALVSAIHQSADAETEPDLPQVSHRVMTA